MLKYVRRLSKFFAQWREKLWDFAAGIIAA